MIPSGSVGLTQNAAVDVAAIRTWGLSHVSRGKCPDRWYVTDSIAKTDRGKVDRRVVAARCIDPRSQPEPPALSHR